MPIFRYSPDIENKWKCNVMLLELCHYEYQQIFFGEFMLGMVGVSQEQ